MPLRIVSLFVLFIAGIGHLNAQFRAGKRTADKQFELGTYPAAIASYQRALAERPDDVEVLTRLGDAYRLINELDSARLHYERAMSNRRAAPEALLAYAQTLKSLGEYERARTLFLTYASEGEQRVGNHFAASVDFAISQRDETAGYAVTAAPFNSYVADFGPAMVGPTALIFNSARLEGAYSGVAENKPYRIEQNTLGQWQSPQELGTGYLSRSGNVGPVSYSPDGTMVVFTRNTFVPGTRMVPEAGSVLSLLIADVNEEGRWNNVRPLPFNGSGFSTGYGSFGADGNDIYFASNRPGGYGGYDLYRVRFRREGDFEAVPENLGETVNSAGNEITPYFDGSSLYFSSDWHMGLGAYDVFRAEVNAAKRPVALYHLGGAVNSSRDDYGFVYDAGQRRGYLSSNRPGGKGAEDIYTVILTELPLLADAGAPVDGGGAGGPQAGAPRGVSERAPVPYGRVRGYVSDQQTGGPVTGATVIVTDQASGQATTVQTDAEGAYYVEVEPLTAYEVEVEVPGYDPVSFPLRTEASTSPNAFGNIQLPPHREAKLDQVAPPAPTVEPEQYGRVPVADPAPAAPATGFSVQVANLARPPVMAEYGALEDVGPVYVSEENGRYKVRVGGFAGREEAQRAVATVAERGYTDSFITAGAPAPAPSPTAAPRTVDAPALDPSPEVALAAYRVQIGAYGNVANFNRKKAEALGELGSTERSKLTVFYIDDLATLSEAEAVRNRAEAAGFVGAYILKLVNGSYQQQ